MIKQISNWTGETVCLPYDLSQLYNVGIYWLCVSVYYLFTDDERFVLQNCVSNMLDDTAQQILTFC
jgi:hypothetical protein